MTKIAYIARNLNVNGISSVIINYAENLVKKNYRVDFFVGNPVNKINAEKCKKNNIRIIKTPSKKSMNPLRYYQFLMKNLKGYDIVHINGNSATVLLELIIAKINKNRLLVTHSHNISSDFKMIHYILRPFINKISNINFACSKDAGEWMFKNKYIILPNGLDTHKYEFNIEKRKLIRKKLKIEDKFVIGHVGNFSDQKNYPFIIDLFDEICKIDDNAVLLLVGNYENNILLKEKILCSKNSNKIILYGVTDKIYNLYNAMDVFLFPSKYEGLGIVLLEAQCNGLKCVVSDFIPKEAVIDPKLVTFLSLNETKEKWKKSIIDSKTKIDRKELFTANKNKIEKYDIKKVILRLEKIYKKEECYEDS